MFRRYAGRVKHTVVVGAIVLATTLLLSGCFFPQSNGGSTGGGTGGSGQSGQSDGADDAPVTPDSNPGDVDLGSFDGLPTSFPSSEVPILAGDVPIGIDLGTGWSVMVKVDDLVTAFAEASAALKNAGYEVLAEQSTADGAFGAYQNAKYLVQLSVSDNPDYRLTAAYVVIIRD